MAAPDQIPYYAGPSDAGLLREYLNIIIRAINALIQYVESSVAPSFPIMVNQGGTGADNAADARVNLGLGDAAVKAVSDGSQDTVASVSGTTTVGHVAKFSDTSGTIEDGGIVPSISGSVTATHVAIFSDTSGNLEDGGVLGTSASKAASGSGGTVASVSGAIATGHIAIFSDTNGTIEDGGDVSGLATSGVNTNIAALNGLGMRSVSAATTVLDTDQVIEVDATTADVTVTYPLTLVASGKAKIVKIVKIDTSNNLVNVSDGTNVVYSLISPANGNQYQSCDVYSNQTSLRVL